LFRPMRPAAGASFAPLLHAHARRVNHFCHFFLFFSTPLFEPFPAPRPRLEPPFSQTLTGPCPPRQLLSSLFYSLFPPATQASHPPRLETPFCYTPTGANPPRQPLSPLFYPPPRVRSGPWGG
jgi:hypothetical protein